MFAAFRSSDCSMGWVYQADLTRWELQTVCVGRIQPAHIEKSLVPHFSDDTVLVTDSHRAYRTVASRHKIPLKQIPSGKHTSGGYHLGHINGYHHNISDFMYMYHGVSSKFLDYYLALFYWIEKNKSRPYIEQAYDIITLLANQSKKIPLASILNNRWKK